jgi:hypothetical protein
MFCTGGSRACIRRPSMSQICSMGFKSGLTDNQLLSPNSTTTH